MNGAAGSTLDAVRSALRYDELTTAEVNSANRALIERYAAPADKRVRGPGGETAVDDEAPPFTLTIANSVWSASASSFRFHDSYIAAMREMYATEARAIDFADPAAAAEINAWASAATAGRISEVITPDVLAELWFVLLNATYFKANWLSEFPEGNTHEAGFVRADGSKSTVQMMEQFSDFAYLESEQYQAVKLPYAESTVSMLVVLPKPGFSLDELVAGSRIGGAALLDDFRAGAEERRVKLSLPKFGFAYSAQLKAVLQALGMDLAFSDLADFSLLGSPATKVDFVKQDTFVKVDEKGTEAAAVTVIGGVPTSAPAGDPILLVVDRPFLVMIVDDDLDLPIFSGLVMNPEWN